jgi:diguanylate cyclase (GGDEF)-like protein
LKSYARALSLLPGVRSASLFLPAASGFPASLLFHDGEAPVPELADVAAADGFHGDFEEQAGAGVSPSAWAPSRSAGGRLYRVPMTSAVTLPARVGPEATRRRSDERATASQRPSVWVGLTLDDSYVEDESGALGPLITLAGTLAWHTRQASEVLDDPVTGLPGRPELQAVLGLAMLAARDTGTPLALVLTNPDEFGAVNEKFGRDAGDRAMREVASRFRASLRDTDLVAKFGGSIFAAVLIDVDFAALDQVGQKLIAGLSEGAYLDGAVRLGFSCGAALFNPDDDAVREPLDLVRRADQALNAAKRAGGGRVALWRPGSEAEEVGNLDRLSGIFTGNMAKDYRNMVLLWETVSVIAASAVFEELAAQVVERIRSAFKPDRVLVFDWTEDGEPRPVTDVGRSGAGSAGEKSPSLDERRRALLEQARTRGVAQDARLSDAEGERLAYAIPLSAREQCLGCLYLEGRAGGLALDFSDLVFLKALASQVAVAMDRSRLAEQERSRLLAQVDELRHVLEQATLEYRSEQMESLIATARRVAPTDATVLVTGESGTGKELVARMIHQLSRRRERPLTIVDCGAIPSSLIESELFGHEKGAYTGAQQRRIGRLAEADGGTLLLDEIGELPLEVQSKLLRFVQGKEITLVGGTKTMTVDVRLIAATNRDLAAEVQAGRFRADLFYRLNVVRLTVPPLRQRPDDVLHLSNHYLEKYALLYQKRVKRLTPEAEALLLRNPWPGNVRELQNRIMEAVILCEGTELGPGDLGLADPARIESEIAETPETRASASRLEERLRGALGRQIDDSLRTGRLPSPLGKWLTEDLLREAARAAGGVTSRAAMVVGVPETTLRRRLQQSAAREEAGLSPRSATWNEVRELLAALVRSEGRGGEDLSGQVQSWLFDEVLSRVPDDVETGAALLGVSPPTFRRRVALRGPVANPPRSRAPIF